MSRNCRPKFNTAMRELLIRFDQQPPVKALNRAVAEALTSGEFRMPGVGGFGR